MSISLIEQQDGNDITAERIVALMFRHRLTVTSLAAAIGKGRASISTKLNGHARWYNDELVQIAMVLDTTVGYLLGETDDDRRPAHLQKREKETPDTLVSGVQYAGGVNPRDLTIMSRAL